MYNSVTNGMYFYSQLSAVSVALSNFRNTLKYLTLVKFPYLQLYLKFILFLRLLHCTLKRHTILFTQLHLFQRLTCDRLFCIMVLLLLLKKKM